MDRSATYVYKENSGISARDLFKIYNNEISFKTFRRRLEELKNNKLITLNYKKENNRDTCYVYYGFTMNLNDF